MRDLTPPPPSLRCKLCGGELQLKLIESAGPQFELENEVFSCVNCGQQQTYTVTRDRYTPNLNVT